MSYKHMFSTTTSIHFLQLLKYLTSQTLTGHDKYIQTLASSGFLQMSQGTSLDRQSVLILLVTIFKMTQFTVYSTSIEKIVKSKYPNPQFLKRCNYINPVSTLYNFMTDPLVLAYNLRNSRTLPLLKRCTKRFQTCSLPHCVKKLDAY